MNSRNRARIIAGIGAALLALPLPASLGASTTHWAFQPLTRPPLPSVSPSHPVRNPIDLFVSHRLNGFPLSPPADRATLLRRLHLDLLGLPPQPADVDRFVADPDPLAYERQVDTLLSSPHFGERWGRHWLDLARYADSTGYQLDHPRPHAYVYRNWVIQSFNRDQPFDQFTIEQLAGDLLPNATAEQKTATGFHRNTLMNHEDGTDPEEFRCKAKVDRVATTGTVWLGLTLGCAQCHDHKYDPVTQREFFQFYALFNNTSEPDIPSRQPDEYDQHLAAIGDWTRIESRLNAALEACSDADPARSQQLRTELDRHRKSKPTCSDPLAQVITENTNAAKTFIHVRGDFLRPGAEVQPGVIAALHPFEPRTPQADRLDLARWIATPNNPLTARVAVNHFWQHLFGHGLVRTPEDFGTQGEPPSHPQLLDWLATEFIEQGWSRKALLRTILTSATYRQSSTARPGRESADPQNLLLARQNRFRLESEIVRDLCLAGGGLLNTRIAGPSFRPHLPPDVIALGDAGAFTWSETTGPERFRRGLYIFGQRTVPYPVSMTFDQADPSRSCSRRDRSNTPLQALTLLNNELFVHCAQGLAHRMETEPLPNTPARSRVEHGFHLALGRHPTPSELDRLTNLHQQQTELLRKTPEQARQIAGPFPAQPDAAPSASLVLIAQVLLNLDEFITRE